MDNLNDESIKGFASKLANIGKNTGIVIAGCLFAFITITNSTHYVGSGESVRFQNDVSGEHEWVQKEGIKWKAPFFSTVNSYNSVSTIAITDDSKLLETSSATRGPLNIGFADNYDGDIEASFRAKLSTDPRILEYMHQDVKSQENLEGNTFLPFAKDMLNVTANQFLAQNFMQGGKGAFKQRLQEQSDKGMRETRREKVLVSGNVADQSTKSKRSQASTAQQYIYKVVAQKDSKGKIIRRPHSLFKYGITITQVDLGEFVPSGDLKGYVDTIKQRERARAATIAEQSIEREKAITEQLKGERKRTTEKSIALRAKDKAVINGQKEIELAGIAAQKEIIDREKVAKLSIIDKTKDLQVAKASEGIEKANERAAKYKAQSQLHIGLAKAKVLAATYKAYDKTLYSMEIQRDTMLGVTKNLQGINITMPKVNIQGGATSGATTNSLDTVMNAIGVQELKKLAEGKK